MKSNYPNMSYCMCNNTLAGLDQILNAMDEQGDVKFLKDLDMDEMRAFDELIYVAKQFAKRAQKAQDRLVEQNIAEILDRE